MGLAFRRLAVLDLSRHGHQPMVSADGRFVLVFNGEIYNHRSLRGELERQGFQFSGHSDTEVLLGAIGEWGLEAALRRCIGMFALALVDVRERQLALARDRLGEKPLYYGWHGGDFLFASELHALRPYPGFSPRVDRGALTLYMRYGYVPSPYCILEGFHKLRPAHILTLPLDGSARRGKETLRAYWNLPRPQEMQPFQGTPQDCVCALEAVLRDAIRMQRLADVPVGVFFSGGIDSSTLVALMQSESSRPVKTFTIGFPGMPCDESHFAEGVARHLGTDHVTWRWKDTDVLGIAREMPKVYSEPFADDSQIPALAVARLARQQVTVCLSGDGGDELFHGYGRYGRTVLRWEQLQRHRSIGHAWRWGLNAASQAMSMVAEGAFKRHWSARLHRAREQWLPEHLAALYRYRMSRFKAPDLYLQAHVNSPDFFDSAMSAEGRPGDESWLSYLDQQTYLPDDLLVKVDRAAMACSLETRMPFLDHRVVEFAASIPAAIKHWEGLRKWPLRSILKKAVPPGLVDRPKMGFNTPLDRWLRGPLREWAEDALADERLDSGGFFDVAAVRGLWSEHLKGEKNRGLMLWSVLMFEAWKESWTDRSTSVVPTSATSCSTLCCGPREAACLPSWG
jgi:asparagine synthase (glutamine-hydrolysing)